MNPLVSVCMITYNHEQYIAEAMEGVLMQEVDFEVELIIADDASNDKTQEIVNSYIQNHPKGHWIKYTRHNKNLGMMPNFIWALNQCKGKYVALCEGDDYWIDSFKIKKQVEFLKENLEFNSCYHEVLIVNEFGDLSKDFITKKKIKKDSSSIYDHLLYGNFIHTCSYFFRRERFELPRKFDELKVGDFFLFLEVSKNGLCKNLGWTGSVYRFGTGSFTSSGYHNMRKRFKESLYLSRFFPHSNLIRVLLILRFHQDDLFKSNQYLFKPIRNFRDLLRSVSFFQILKALIKIISGSERRKLYE